MNLLAQPVANGGFRFFECAEPSVRIDCESRIIERNVPARKSLAQAIGTERGWPSCIRGRGEAFCSCRNSGRWANPEKQIAVSVVHSENFDNRRPPGIEVPVAGLPAGCDCRNSCGTGVFCLRYGGSLRELDFQILVADVGLRLTRIHRTREFDGAENVMQR